MKGTAASPGSANDIKHDLNRWDAHCTEIPVGHNICLPSIASTNESYGSIQPPGNANGTATHDDLNRWDACCTEIPAACRTIRLSRHGIHQYERYGRIAQPEREQHPRLDLNSIYITNASCLFDSKKRRDSGASSALITSIITIKMERH